LTQAMRTLDWDSIMDNLIVGCYQMDVMPGDVSGNLGKIEKMLPKVKRERCQLLVLPEMWSGGFVYSALQEMADRTPAVLEKLKELAADYRTVLVGSLPEAEGDKIYNTSYVVDTDGVVPGKYRKMHLFSLTGEHDRFECGQIPLVCDTSLARLGIEICYDLRFPELSRRLALDGAEILCFSAQWPVTRIDHWSLLLRSRAVENQLFVVACNNCGIEGNTQFGGASAIVSPMGKLLAEAQQGEEFIIARLDFSEMLDFRRHIPCFSDRVPGTYNIL
jgi:omega-amidase